MRNMAKYIVKVRPKAAKSFESIPNKFHKKLLYALSSLEHDPLLGKPLMGRLKGYYSLRVYPYRIIYTILKNELIIIVVDIGHRQGVYN